MDEGAVKPRPVWGAKAIGNEMGLTERQTFHLLERGLLPAKKIGDKWLADANQLHSLITSAAS